MTHSKAAQAYSHDVISRVQFPMKIIRKWAQEELAAAYDAGNQAGHWRGYQEGLEEGLSANLLPKAPFDVGYKAGYAAGLEASLDILDSAVKKVFG